MVGFPAGGVPLQWGLSRNSDAAAQTNRIREKILYNP
jgi:hypothetical protein